MDLAGPVAFDGKGNDRGMSVGAHVEGGGGPHHRGVPAEGWAFPGARSDDGGAVDEITAPGRRAGAELGAASRARPATTAAPRRRA
jgi:hypothetical protein